LVTVYPISAANPPSTPTLKEEKRSIEQREAERRRRVVRGNSISQGGDPDDWWGLEKVESFYKECCASRDEPPLPEISTAFKVGIVTRPPCHLLISLSRMPQGRHHAPSTFLVFN
jgi:protein phosphatase 1 regulatory subunit 37